MLERARAGDQRAFAELVEPHRRELHVHCYRMLGSYDDADDAVQETLLAAWRGLAGFEARATPRTWLHRVATNTCLNLIRAAGRRPRPEVPWLQPYPDALLAELPDREAGPDARLERAEAVSLAFIATLQVLSPRSRAVLILRDVLGFSARETATTLHTSPEAVAVALSRARAALRTLNPAPRPPTPPGSSASPGSPSPAEAELVRRLTAALTAQDVAGVVALLAEDVRISMPPQPMVWCGLDAAARFLAEIPFHQVPRARFHQTRANGQPALATYIPGEHGAWIPAGLLVVTHTAGRVTALTRFDPGAVRAFALPPTP